jgi:hypothetical protein
VIVKTFRIWMLVLLAVLLPLRGAVAAFMPCANGQHEVSVIPAPLGADQAASCAHHPNRGESGLVHAAGCSNACAALCSGAPMTAALPAVKGPLEPARVMFPALALPALSFCCDGQDRPPRSI